MPKYPMPKILIVDDDELLCELLTEELLTEKFVTDYVCDGSEALPKIKNNYYNIILLNQHMKFIHGDQVLPKIKEYDPTLPVIMVSGQTDPAIVVKCIKLGAEDYIGKPYDYDELLDKIIKYIR